MIQSVWKNLTGLQKAAEHLWCDFKCRPWAEILSPNTACDSLLETHIQSIWNQDNLSWVFDHLKKVMSIKTFLLAKQIFAHKNNFRICLTSFQNITCNIIAK